jgi:hypothetical protein
MNALTNRWSALCALLLLAASQAMAQPTSAQFPWPTKASLLAAARAGEFRDLAEIRGNVEERTLPLTNSVFAILRSEYGVPPLPATRECQRSAASEVYRLMALIAQAHGDTLTQQPPTFRREPNLQGTLAEANAIQKRIGSGGGFCEQESGGMRKPHPYGAAFMQFLPEFAKASDEWAEAERTRRKAAYDEQMGREQAAADKQRGEKERAEAERRAAEQKRIDAERARIEADEKRRRETDKKRTAG